MTRVRRVAALAGATLCIAAVPAWAQSAPERVRLALTFGSQVTPGGFSQSFRRPLNQEAGAFAANLTTGTALVGEGSIGVRLPGPLGAGVTLSNMNGTSGGDVSATVPHPFYFGRPRSVAGEVTGLRRQEVAVHAELAWMHRLSPSAELTVFGGPSYFSVREALVTDVRLTEQYPYDSAAFAGIASITGSRNGLGMNAGADVTWRRWRHVGLGGQVRYTRAPVTITAAPGNETTVTAGGPQAGAGVRVFF